jgi:hypothetical protein
MGAEPDLRNSRCPEFRLFPLTPLNEFPVAAFMLMFVKARNRRGKRARIPSGRLAGRFVGGIRADPFL